MEAALYSNTSVPLYQSTRCQPRKLWSSWIPRWEPQITPVSVPWSKIRKLRAVFPWKVGAICTVQRLLLSILVLWRDKSCISMRISVSLSLCKELTSFHYLNWKRHFVGSFQGNWWAVNCSWPCSETLLLNVDRGWSRMFGQYNSQRCRWKKITFCNTCSLSPGLFSPGGKASCSNEISTETSHNTPAGFTEICHDFLQLLQDNVAVVPFCAAGNNTIKKFIICFFRQILLRWRRQRELNGLANLPSDKLKGRDCLENQSVDGKIIWKYTFLK